jgi:tetratricopeptide (TPR) repeat protein
MADFPWSELGLDGPSDERAIRRAYAARLKVVRPDLDAAGFQRLVQARDAALRAIEHTALRPLLRPIPPPDPTPQREGTAPESGEPAPPAARQPPVPEPGAASPPARPPVIEPAQAAASPDTVSMLLSAFVEAWRQDQSHPAVAPILKALGEQSIVARQKLEIEALRAVASLFDQNLFDPKLAKAKQQAARSLIVALDDEYAWTSSDRRLYQMMPQAQADQFGRLLRVVREWESTGLAPKFAPPAEVPARSEIPARLVLAGLGFLCFVIFKGLSLSTPHVAVPTQVSINVPEFYGRAAPSTPAAPSILVVPSTPASPATPGIRLDPISAAFSFNRGLAYDNNSQVDRAIHEYSEAIRLNPNYPLAYYNRGLDYASKGEFDRAIRDYDQAIRLNPANPDIFVSRGVAYSGKGLYDRAIQDYDQAIRLRPDDALAFVDRGVAHADKGEYDRAIQDYDQAIRIDPNDPDAWRNRGLAKQAKGDTTGGDADSARATQLDSPLPPASPQAVAGKQIPSAGSDSSPPATTVKHIN